MASNRTNYTSSASSYRPGCSSSGNYCPRTNSSYSFSTGTAKFSSILSSSSSFSPSSYLSNKYSLSSQDSKLGGTNYSSGSTGSSSSRTGIISTNQVSSSYGTTNTNTKSNFGSTSSLTREKSNVTDGFGVNSSKLGTSSDERNNSRQSSSHLRSSGNVSNNTSGNSRSSGTRIDGGSGNDARKSAGIPTTTTFNKSGSIGCSGNSPTTNYQSIHSPGVTNSGSRVTTELKSSTGGGGVTYGTIGSSAIASLRSTAPPRYGLKANVNLPSSIYTPYTTCNSISLNSGKSHRDRADDFTSTNSNVQRLKENNKEITTSSLKLMSRGTSPQIDEAVDASVKSSKISQDEELERSGIPLSKHQSTSYASGINSESSSSKILHKEVQTDKIPVHQANELIKSLGKPYVSSIPRPSTTFYSPFSSALSRFTGNNEPLSPTKKSNSIIINTNKVSDSMIKTSEPSSETESSSSSASIINSKGVKSSSSSSSTSSPTVSANKKQGLRKEIEGMTGGPCHVPHYINNCNNGKNSSSSLNKRESPQSPNNRRPPTDPNKLPQSRSGSKSTIPTLCNKSPTSPISPTASSSFKSKSVPKNNGNSIKLRKSSSSSSDHQDSNSGDLVKGRRGSGTSSSSSTSSRSNSSERSSSSISSSKVIIVKNETQPEPSAQTTTGFKKILVSPVDKLSWMKRSPEAETTPWWLTKENSPQSNHENGGIIIRNTNYSTSSRDITPTNLSRENSQEFNDKEVEDRSSTRLPELQSLGDRTSPDGTEIPSPQVSTTPINNEDRRYDEKIEKQLFISSDMTNIDDILGVVPLSPSIQIEIPTFSGTGYKKLKKFEKISSKRVDRDLSDDESNENSDTMMVVVGAIGHDHQVDFSDSESDDNDGASTGTSSSFEEVNPSNLTTNKLNVLQTENLKPSCSYKERKNINPWTTEDFPSASASASSNLASSDGFNNLAKNLSSTSTDMSNTLKLDDATLQIYRDGDFGPYLDLEGSINEQPEEFESFLTNRKNSIVLRAQLPVRVNAIIEKLLTADGRELRRALFSLKQIFQEDKDLVHEFVENGGLSCLIKVGSEADQNYQNYILRALGQVMLYVDGMYGVMRHNETIQWLYILVASKFRLVQKTALKLLLVFVDYVETNCLLLVEAVSSVDSMRGAPLWTNVMNLLHEYDSGDTELLVYAMSLVNKVLNGIPDIDTYYDQVDALEEQGMAVLIQKYMGKQCADLDLLQQLQIYEVVLKHEDGEEDIMLQLDESMRQKLMNRKGYIELDSGGAGKKGRRKSRRHSSNSLNLNLTPPTTPTGNGLLVTSFPHPMIRRLSSTEDSRRDSDEWSNSDVSSTHSSSPAPSVTGSVMSSPIILSSGFTQENYSTDVGITPGLRKRRERAEHQRSLTKEQNHSHTHTDHLHLNCNGQEPDEFKFISTNNPDSPLIPLGRSPSTKRDVNNLVNSNGSPDVNKTRPWGLPVYPNANGSKSNVEQKENGISKDENEKNLIQLKRENTVKDLTQKLSSQSLISSPPVEEKTFSRIGDLSGIISKAKEGLAKSKSKADIKPSQSSESNGTSSNHVTVENKSDNELHWDFLVSNLSRSLAICDLDFTELKSDDDVDVVSPHLLCNMTMINGCPPPPMPTGIGPPPPPPSGGKFSSPPQFKHPPSAPAPPVFGVSLKQQTGSNSTETFVSKQNSKKTKKTVKLFWKEVREDPMTAIKVKDIGSIWDEIQPVPLDTQKLEHLFESRAKDVINKEKQQDVNKFKEIVVLDPKRSNAINIGMTKLPPPRTIKTAIMKMDSTIINREGIEKLLTMLPTDEERAKIQEAQFAKPDTPLGNAEQFLLTLASISELTARLKLWAFKLDYENLEKEIAEPLMDLKLGIESLQTNKTFRCILTTLLCIGNFLNGADAKGFQIEYLAKVPEVKDTVHKHSLLHHLCHTVIEQFPESTDLYSEIGPVTRASRVDFDELAANLAKMETDCKASWDYLRLIAKHDGPTNMKLKMSEFLADCAERIIVLGIIHRRVVNRFHKFLLWLGVSAHQVTTTKPHYMFKVVSEFALEYRTTRERVIQQLQKKANHRERNKTRGKMITEQIMYKTKEDKADAELRQVLNTSSDPTEEVVTGSLTWTRRSKAPNSNNNSLIQNNLINRPATLNRIANLGDGDDEILESLVKTATQTPATRTAPRERKRNNSRYTERKSLRRTLRSGLSDEERKLLATFMANGHSF